MKLILCMVIRRCVHEGNRGIRWVFEADRIYRNVGTLWLKEQYRRSRTVVVLQGGLVIVANGPWVGGLDQEVVVHAPMLKVMDCC